MTTARAAAALLITLPLAFNLCFFLLARTFDYPEVLRRPTSEVLARFRAGGSRLLLLWWVFADREREVLHAMATGRNNATIASTLFMSERAVEKHIGAVLQKLGLVDEHVTNRRVMAVLAYLEAIGPSRPDPTR